MTIAVPALATKPTYVSGSLWWAGEPSNVVMRPAGNNCFIDVDVPYFFDGDLFGNATLHFKVVSHGLCPAAPFQYNENLKAQGTFDGEVDGKIGTFDLKLVGKGWPAEPGELALTAKIVVLSGTGELANLHGVLDVSYIMGDATDSYSGQIHFDPQP
jgi:hypothetical protein